MWTELKSLFEILPIIIGISFTLGIIILVFVSLCSSVLKESLNKNKVLCRHCGKLHKRNFEFADIPFCNYQCFEEFTLSLKSDDLLKLNEIDMTINKYK